MPEQPGNLDSIGETFRIGFPKLRAGSPQEADHNRAANDVQRMQAGKREINRRVGVVPRAVGAHRGNL